MKSKRKHGVWTLRLWLWLWHKWSLWTSSLGLCFFFTKIMTLHEATCLVFSCFKLAILIMSSVQLLSPVWLFATPWTAAHQASLSITNSWSSPKLMSIESVMPSNHLVLCRPLRLSPSIFPSIRVLSNEAALHIRSPKYWSFSFNISPSNEHSGLISFRIDGLISLYSKGLSRVFSNTRVQNNQFFGTQLSL